MANFRYFAECGGNAVMLTNVAHDGHISSAANHFDGKCPVCGTRHAATRKIIFRSNPSRHECDARCIHATGKVMNCECSCGGKNHGRGH